MVADGFYNARGSGGGDNGGGGDDCGDEGEDNDGNVGGEDGDDGGNSEIAIVEKKMVDMAMVVTIEKTMTVETTIAGMMVDYNDGGDYEGGDDDRRDKGCGDEVKNSYATMLKD